MKKIIILVAFFSLFFINSVSAAEFSTNLKYGAKGNDVTRLQEFLTEQGLYNGPITGNFFSLTLKAVKAFQARESITPVSGFFGSLTRAKVNEILDNQLVESNVAEAADPIAEPVVVAPAPVSAEVLRLNEIVGAVQSQTVVTNQQLNVLQEQNQILQSSLDVQRAEADRLKAIADADQARLQAIEQARLEQEALNRQALLRTGQVVSDPFASAPCNSIANLSNICNGSLAVDHTPFQNGANIVYRLLYWNRYGWATKASFDTLDKVVAEYNRLTSI